MPFYVWVVFCFFGFYFSPAFDSWEIASGVYSLSDVLCYTPRNGLVYKAPLEKQSCVIKGKIISCPGILSRSIAILEKDIYLIV